MNRSRIAVLGLVCALSLAGCAHSVPKAEYPPNANAPEEIQRLDSELNTLGQQGTDMLSAEHYKAAREKLDDAKTAQEKGKSQAEVLDELGYARAHYNLAVKAGDRGRQLIPNVLEARNNALRAGAQNLYPKEFKKSEKEFKTLTSRIEDEKEVSADDRNELQRKYLDLELKAIKKNRLGQAEAKIEQAQDNDAKKYAPKTHEEAIARYRSAAAVIEANRSDSATIDPAVAAADEQAQKLAEVTQIVADSDGKTSEEAALAIVDQRREIAEKEEALRTSQASSARQAGALEELKEENKALATEARFTQALKEAQKMFKPEEAEAYRQNDKLVLRLKKVNFASGRADLPKDSLDTLAKVKNVVEVLDAEKVTIEGHTDSVGGRAANETLSQKRADSVKEYLVSQEALDDEAVEAVGVGFENPIAPNKTKEGRAKNRRVDIIITPNQG